VNPSLEDQVMPQHAKLLQIFGHLLRVPLLAASPVSLLNICLRGGSIFSLGHPATKAFSRSRRKLSIRWGGNSGELQLIVAVERSGGGKTLRPRAEAQRRVALR
jgi:hypothetical protein